ncbi:hypothetical protein TTHERM_000412109 (macronuclear) [Tetrahymena thermophila SB210]|uniref:Uncharacterized protein n=1 Tax=Tetrahymena thermophila (strain SB210) TaxID=312017 RepID=W7X9Y6_TETTS|nr:hypothetical protein TTHERM_000412109 [Tetrahymena thermophila SB210]EWS73208.1 hypothetical protein TTHERM_000412109 [Tetrahymena thermophila SB210]|eukprot:XP_012654284.1 hypothetical protein TTHERM_000412109 [Tetrahymena thermophila SB210]
MYAQEFLKNYYPITISLQLSLSYFQQGQLMKQTLISIIQKSCAIQAQVVTFFTIKSQMTVSFYIVYTLYEKQASIVNILSQIIGIPFQQQISIIKLNLSLVKLHSAGIQTQIC